MKCFKPENYTDRKDYILEWLRYDPLTGLIWWKKCPCPRLDINKPAGSKYHGYVNIKVKGKLLQAHRIAWFFIYGYFPELYIDHIDNNPFNNRPENLREVTNRENTRNKKIHNQGKLLGTSFNKRVKRYYSRSTISGKSVHLGYFENEIDAHIAFLKYEEEYNNQNGHI